MMPLGLAACYGVPQTPGPADNAVAPPTASDPTKGEGVEPGSAAPDPTGHEPAPPDVQPEAPPPAPEAPDMPDDPEAGDNTKPEGTQTPIVPDPRPAKKYGAPPRPDVDRPEPPPEPPRPATKYGAPPRPRPAPSVPENP